MSQGSARENGLRNAKPIPLEGNVPHVQGWPHSESRLRGNTPHTMTQFVCDRCCMTLEPRGSALAEMKAVLEHGTPKSLGRGRQTHAVATKHEPAIAVATERNRPAVLTKQDPPKEVGWHCAASAGSELCDTIRLAGAVSHLRDRRRIDQFHWMAPDEL